MINIRRLLPRCYYVVLAATASLFVTGCSDNATAPVEMELNTGSPATSSDFIDRQLPNPVREVILNWAPLPEGREWGSTAGIDVGPDGHIWRMTAVAGWPWLEDVRRIQIAIPCSNSTRIPAR